MKKTSITKKISIATIGLIAMLALLAAPMYAGKASAMEPMGKTATDSQRSGMTSAGEMSRQDVIQASTLMDRDVHDAQGNKIGSVADMMIGPDGNVRYIVLSQKDGFLGMGKKNLVPVPWSKVNARDIGDDQKALTLSLSKQQLENAPSFNNDEWKAFLRAEKQQEVRGFYGTEDARPGQEPRGYYETEGASPSGQDQMMKDKTGQDSNIKTRDQDKMMKDKPQDSTIKTPNYNEKRNETQRKGADGNF